MYAGVYYRGISFPNRYFSLFHPCNSEDDLARPAADALDRPQATSLVTYAMPPIWWRSCYLCANALIG
jgi:hypothetical protein